MREQTVQGKNAKNSNVMTPVERNIMNTTATEEDTIMKKIAQGLVVNGSVKNLLETLTSLPVYLNCMYGDRAIGQERKNAYGEKRLIKLNANAK